MSDYQAFLQNRHFLLVQIAGWNNLSDDDRADIVHELDALCVSRDDVAKAAGVTTDDLNVAVALADPDEDSKEDGEATYDVTVDGVAVTVILQRWRGRISGKPLGSTYHLQIDGQDVWEDENALTDWPCDDAPSVDRIRQDILESRPDLLPGN